MAIEGDGDERCGGTRHRAVAPERRLRFDVMCVTRESTGDSRDAPG